MAKKAKTRIDTSGAKTPGFGSLGAAFKDAGFPGTGGAPETASDSAPSLPADDRDMISAQTGLFLQLERKGRGGKRVTIVGGFHMSEKALTETARTMARALGCGATAEPAAKDSRIILQGDIRERAEKWLLNANARLRVSKK